MYKLEQDGFLHPDPKYSYFPLREDIAGAVSRGTLFQDASSQDLVLIQLVFSAVGVATLWPDILSVYTVGESKRYRFNDTLQKEYRSADGFLLYSIEY